MKNFRFRKIYNASRHLFTTVWSERNRIQRGNFCNLANTPSVIPIGSLYNHLQAEWAQRCICFFLQEFVQQLRSGEADDFVHYFLCLVKCSGQVIPTQMVSTLEGLEGRTLDFPNLINLTDLPKAFFYFCNCSPSSVCYGAQKICFFKGWRLENLFSFGN